jgi:hypothetical protein
MRNAVRAAAEFFARKKNLLRKGSFFLALFLFQTFLCSIFAIDTPICKNAIFKIRTSRGLVCYLALKAG